MASEEGSAGREQILLPSRLGKPLDAQPDMDMDNWKNNFLQL